MVLLLRLALAVGGVLLAAKLLASRRTVFVSYDYDRDSKHKNMLLAWAQNSRFDLEFEDYSSDISINSTDEGAIKRAISAKINRADCFLCLVGERTHARPMVNWEISKAVDLDKPIVVVKIRRDCTTPESLYNIGAKWAKAFKFDSIKRALESA